MVRTICVFVAAVLALAFLGGDPAHHSEPSAESKAEGLALKETFPEDDGTDNGSS
jgi:hypothetical protein